MSETRYSHSQIQTFKNCPLSYFFKYVVGLEKISPGAESHHLEYGKAMHEGLRMLYQAKQKIDLLPRYLQDALIGSDAGDRLIGAMRARTRSTFFDLYQTQLDPADKAKTQANGVTALDGYFDQWSVLDSRYVILDCEGLDIDIRSDDPYALRLDLVIQDKEGHIYGVDHKITKKSLTYQYWSTYEPNSQVTQYIDWIREKYGRCDGFIINAISMQWRDKWEYFEPDDPKQPWLEYVNYEGPIYSKYHKREMVKAQGLRLGFERQTFTRTDEQIEQERESIRKWKSRIIEDIEVWAQCEEYGMSPALAFGFNTAQCQFCEYHDICKPGWSWPLDQELIQLQYKQVCNEVCNSGSRCKLDKGHDGNHSAEPPIRQTEQIEEMNVEIEL